MFFLPFSSSIVALALAEDVNHLRFLMEDNSKVGRKLEDSDSDSEHWKIRKGLVEHELHYKKRRTRKQLNSRVERQGSDSDYSVNKGKMAKGKERKVQQDSDSDSDSDWNTEDDHQQLAKQLFEEMTIGLNKENPKVKRLMIFLRLLKPNELKMAKELMKEQVSALIKLDLNKNQLDEKDQKLKLTLMMSVVQRSSAPV